MNTPSRKKNLCRQCTKGLQVVRLVRERVLRSPEMKTQRSTAQTREVNKAAVTKSLIRDLIVVKVSTVDLVHTLNKTVPVQSYNSFLNPRSPKVIVRLFHRNHFPSVYEPLHHNSSEDRWTRAPLNLDSRDPPRMSHSREGMQNKSIPQIFAVICVICGDDGSMI